MALEWLKKQLDDGSGGDGIEIKPEDFKKKLDTIDELKTKFDGLDGTLDKKLEPVMNYLKSQQQKEEDARKAAEAEEQRKQQQQFNVDSIDWTVDPEGATKKTLAPLVKMQLETNARLNREDTLRDMDYYHGDIKSKVDGLIAAQPLQNQSNPTVIMNAYKSVVFDHMTEINEGKIKSRTAAATFSSNGTGGASGKGAGEQEEQLSEEEKKIARLFGISEKDYASSRKEVSYSHV